MPSVLLLLWLLTTQTLQETASSPCSSIQHSVPEECKVSCQQRYGLIISISNCSEQHGQLSQVSVAIKPFMNLITVLQIEQSDINTIPTFVPEMKNVELVHLNIQMKHLIKLKIDYISVKIKKLPSVIYSYRSYKSFSYVILTFYKCFIIFPSIVPNIIYHIKY